MAKKKKKIIAKRRAQAKTKKQKRAKIKSRKTKTNIQYIERPAISNIDTPAGFRAISMSQGMIEYAKPLMDYVEKGIIKDPNVAFQLRRINWS